METSDPKVFERELDISFDLMAEILPDITRTALNVGANILKERVKSAFISKVPGATKPLRAQKINGSYQISGGDRLVDAVRQGRFDSMTNSTKVHILGGREKGGGTFIARFFDSGTKERYAKKYNGVQLKKKRFTGRIKTNDFFVPAVEAALPEALSTMEQIIDKKIDAVMNNGQ